MDVYKDSGRIRQHVSCLVIDDDMEDQEIFMLAMQETLPTAVCSFSSDGTDAINKLETNDLSIPDYIFLDWNLVLSDPIECIRRLRTIDGAQHVMISILSGEIPMITEREMRELGITKLLRKQGTIPELSRELRKVVANV